MDDSDWYMWHNFRAHAYCPLFTSFFEESSLTNKMLAGSWGFLKFMVGRFTSMQEEIVKNVHNHVTLFSEKDTNA